MKLSASQRGRANRAKGAAFERRIAKKLRDAGFRVRKTDELNGFVHGWDLEVYEIIRPFTSDHPEVRYVLPAVIQCKHTADPADLERGFQQAIKNKGEFHACLHSHNRKLSILSSWQGHPPRLITWEEFLDRLHALRRIKSSPRLPATLSSSARRTPPPVLSISSPPNHTINSPPPSLPASVQPGSSSPKSRGLAGLLFGASVETQLRVSGFLNNSPELPTPASARFTAAYSASL